MSTISVKINSASALVSSDLSGTDLPTADAQQLKSKLDWAQELGDAIRTALADARNSGVVAFRPNSPWLQLPTGLPDEIREELFSKRMGNSYGGGELSLQSWSSAIQALESWSAQARSTLPPGLGGGIQFVNGLWYVNGQSLTLSEVYLANRVNIYVEMDKLLSESLNGIAANNQLVHQMNKGMKYLSEKLQNWISSYDANTAYSDDKKDSIYLFASSLWTTAQGGSVTNSEDTWGSEWLKFVAWGKKTYGSDGVVNQYSSTGLGWGDFANISLNRSDALKLRDELQAFIDSKTADNQIAQTRTESIFTTRANLLEGMGAFMKGQQNTAAGTARNIGA